MYSIRVEEGFAAAHFLQHYHGKCERLHGHNYRVRVTVSGNALDGGGMLVDFAVLKDSLRAVVAELDHTSLNDHPAFSDGCPSAERIAELVFTRMSEELADRLQGAAPFRARLSLVEVFETEKNRATYSPD